MDQQSGNDDQPILVVLGLDDTGKSRASRFTPADSEQAVLAARLMNMHAVNVTDVELRKVASELPMGRIYATGRGLVPFVKRDLYDKLAVLLGTEAEQRDQRLAHLRTDAEIRQSKEAEPSVTTTDDSASVSKASAAESSSDDPWTSIRVGTTVLARSQASDEGWFEAVVSSIAADKDELTLRWRDFSGEPVFKRKRRTVGVLA